MQQQVVLVQQVVVVVVVGDEGFVVVVYKLVELVVVGIDGEQVWCVVGLVVVVGEVYDVEYWLVFVDLLYMLDIVVGELCYLCQFVV